MKNKNKKKLLKQKVETIYELEVQLNEWSQKSKEEIVSQRLERFNQY